MPVGSRSTLGAPGLERDILRFDVLPCGGTYGKRSIPGRLRGLSGESYRDVQVVNIFRDGVVVRDSAVIVLHSSAMELVLELLRRHSFDGGRTG